MQLQIYYIISPPTWVVVDFRKMRKMTPDRPKFTFGKTHLGQIHKLRSAGLSRGTLRVFASYLVRWTSNMAFRHRLRSSTCAVVWVRATNTISKQAETGPAKPTADCRHPGSPARYPRNHRRSHRRRHGCSPDVRHHGRTSLLRSSRSSPCSVRRPWRRECRTARAV